MVKFDLSKGVRDYDGVKAELLEKITDTGKDVFKKYGFLPLDTPAIEKFDVLASKDVNAGEEIKEQTYNFKDRGGKHVGLRYDLTVPLIRYIAMNPLIPLPFKRYQIGKVWRYEEAKRSRYREFYQMDIDIIGSNTEIKEYWDAEVIIAMGEVMKKIGLEEFKVYINNRKVIERVIENLGVKGSKEVKEKVLRLIDKTDKITKQEFVQELITLTKIKEGEAKKIYELINKEYSTLDELKNELNIENEEGMEELKKLEEMLKDRGFKDYVFSLKIVRGLNYYTGNVFETFVKGNKEVGSVASGGRYDEIYGKTIKRDLSAVGMSLGVDRVIDILSKKYENKVKGVVITPAQKNISKEVLKYIIKIRENLLKKGLEVEVDIEKRNLTNRISSASKRGRKYIIIIGERGIKEGKVTIRNLESGEEEEENIKNIEGIIEKLKR